MMVRMVFADEVLDEAGVLNLRSSIAQGVGARYSKAIYLRNAA